MSISLDNTNLTRIIYNGTDVDKVIYNNVEVFKKHVLRINFTGRHLATSSSYPVKVKSESSNTYEIAGASYPFSLNVAHGERVTIDFSVYRNFYSNNLPYGYESDGEFGPQIDAKNTHYGFGYDSNKTKLSFIMDKDITFIPYTDYYDEWEGYMGVLYTRTGTYEGQPKRDTDALFLAQVQSNGAVTNLTDVIYS